MTVYDTRRCELGEGAFWHPERRQFFWFDILGCRLLSRLDDEEQEWRFDRMASAAGWIDADRLLISTETGLAVLDLRDGSLTDHVAVEAARSDTRSNDGRADPHGGFWLSTMGKGAEKGQGAIYRYLQGEVTQLFTGITIPNAICFSPDGKLAYFADTAEGIVWTQPLDGNGWPQGEKRVFLDLKAEALNPDGAVIDAEGGFCCAMFGAGAVMRFDPDGRRTDVIEIGGKQATCPAFGGEGLNEMLVTTALEGMEDPDSAQGVPHLVRPGLKGYPEPKVIL